MNTSSLDNLELRALEQRNHLHHTATELKTQITAVREKMNVARNAREHLIGATMIVAAFSLLSGYGFAGMFTRN
ncbi:MAG: hypothetical protein JWQ87_88 [Candidatus Sulfotelmatobacter sp.]|nr:hypothetical protein [Candidatus Sulfotelmatobacter sp.]